MLPSPADRLTEWHLEGVLSAGVQTYSGAEGRYSQLIPRLPDKTDPGVIPVGDMLPRIDDELWEAIAPFCLQRNRARRVQKKKGGSRFEGFNRRNLRLRRAFGTPLNPASYPPAPLHFGATPRPTAR